MWRVDVRIWGVILLWVVGCAGAEKRAEVSVRGEVDVGGVEVSGESAEKAEKAEVSVVGQGIDLLKGGDVGDYGHALALFERGCEAGDGEGCYHLGMMYWNGLGVAADVERARGAYEQACEAGDGRSCNVVGVMYREGVGVAVDVERAVAYFRLAVDGADGHGYFNLGVMYLRGSGVGLDRERGEELIEIACNQRGVCPQMDDVGERLEAP